MVKVQANTASTNSGVQTPSTALLLILSAIAPQRVVIRNAASWLSTPKPITQVRSRSMRRSMCTVKNGAARFTAKFQLARNAISRR